MKFDVLRALGVVLCLLAIVGCDKGEVPSVVTVTNVVETTRTVMVTNVVTVTCTVTNSVTVTNIIKRVPERVLSARKTAPYAVASSVLDEARFRRFLSDAGTRVIECSSGAIALVEASDKVVSSLDSSICVKALAPEDKIATDAGEHVCVIPLSFIDTESVVKAIRNLGGEVSQVMTVGQPRIRAKISYSVIHKLAARGDVRRIERDATK